ncbi:MAG: NTP transferase domain-containing protein [Nocardioidaceae bacterium]
MAEIESGPLRLGGVILTGGTAARMDGVAKAGLEVGGVSLLERALAALAAMVGIVVVGPEVPTSRPVAWTREKPARGGPAAALLAGLNALPRDLDAIVVLAVDMPKVTAATVARLVWTIEGDPFLDGAVLVDDEERMQSLCAAYRTDSMLRRQRELGDPDGLSMRVLLDGLHLGVVPAVGLEAADVDTWSDLGALG